MRNVALFCAFSTFLYDVLIADRGGGAHYSGMLRGPFSRGSSALAALVLVAVFGFIALAVSGIAGDGRVALHSDVSAQLAQTSGAVDDVGARLVDPDGRAARCKAPIELQRDKSAKEVVIDTNQAVMNNCVKGCLYDVYQKTTSGTDIQIKDQCVGKVGAEKQECESKTPCMVRTCQLTGSCALVGGGSEALANRFLSERAGVPETLPIKADKDLLAALEASKRDPSAGQQAVSTLPPYLQEAFKEKQKEELAIITKNAQDKQAELARYAEGTVLYENAAKEAAALQAQRDRLAQIDVDALRANAAVAGSGVNPGDQQGGIYPGTDQPGVDCSDGKCVGPDGKPTNGATFPGTGQPGVSEYCRKVGGCIGPDGKVIPKAPPSTPGPRTPQDPGPDRAGGLGGGLGNIAQSLLGSLAKAFGNSGGAGGGSAQACSTDPNAYAQQQQQYNLQLQQYNLQLQQYNQQQYYGGISGIDAPTPPVAPQPCRPSTQSQCQSQPPQPPASSCTSGTWKPVQNGACVSSWQCVPSGASGNPTAQLSCQPKVADVGMSIAISYACGNSTGSSATGFSTNGALSGSATATTTVPSAGASTNVFTLTCSNQAQTASAQCTVQIAKPSIVLVANPKAVKSGEASTIGWITSGMQSCVVSSPDQADFTARNAANTSVSGMATTSPITAATQIDLNCETHGGDVRAASTTITVVN